MITVIIVLSVVSVLLLVAAVALFSGRKGLQGRYEDKIAAQKEYYERLLAEQKESSTKQLAEQKETSDKLIKDLKEDHKATLEAQIAAIKAEMTAQTEQLLKQREEALNKKAEETFKNLSGGIDKSLKDMKTAFDESKKQSSEDAATFGEKFENAVRRLEEQSKNIGNKADHLADAMKGQKKIQGCWGETLLMNLLSDEGFEQGRDYDREETLRDELGFVIKNEDSDQKMRPDFILHFVNDQDVVVDAKVSLAAYARYVECESPEDKEEASKSNLQAIKDQVKRLAGKDYSNYLRPGRKMVDYVIMFVPNYPALQLAYEREPKLWQEAYKSKVLITSAETLMPFLRMINLAWRNVEQVKNQQKIIDAASNMVARVADFAGYMAVVGQKLEDAQKAYDNADKKLRNAGQGILVSAHQVLKLGVPAPAKKNLPEPDIMALPEESERE